MNIQEQRKLIRYLKDKDLWIRYKIIISRQIGSKILKYKNVSQFLQKASYICEKAYVDQLLKF